MRYDAIKQWEKEHPDQEAYRQVHGMTFTDYLKEQPPEFQREYLGATRYNYYREGKLSLDMMVNPDRGFLRTLKNLGVEKRAASQKQKAQLDYSVTETDKRRINPNIKRTYDIQSAADVEGFLKTDKQQELAEKLVNLKQNHSEQTTEIFNTDRELRKLETEILHQFMLGDTQNSSTVKIYSEAFDRSITKLDFTDNTEGKIAKKELRKDGKKGIEFASRLMERFGIDIQKQPPQIIRYGDRPSYNSASNVLDLDKLKDDFGQYIVHEYGHYIEENLPTVKKKCLAFLAEITKGQTERSLKDAMPEFDISPDEKYKPANIPMPTPYATKIMPNSTEILTEGLRYLYNEPVDFVRKYPDYFNFLLTVLKSK